MTAPVAAMSDDRDAGVREGPQEVQREHQEGGEGDADRRGAEQHRSTGGLDGPHDGLVGCNPARSSSRKRLTMNRL